MNPAFWVPGSIVKLRIPYKPSHPDYSLFNAIVGDRTPVAGVYTAWQGFTHGIIVQVYAQDQQGKPSNVSCHLYDPERHLLYIETFAHGIPTYVDFSVEELIPLKTRDAIGYSPT